MTLPRRVPPEPSAAAIQVAQLWIPDAALARGCVTAVLEAQRLAGERAAFAVDAPRGTTGGPEVAARVGLEPTPSSAQVTVAELAARLKELMFAAQDSGIYPLNPDGMSAFIAERLHAHLVPPETP